MGMGWDADMDVDVAVNGVVVSRSAVPFACQSNRGDGA